MLQMFYDSVVAGALFYTIVCWGGALKNKEASQLTKVIKKAGSVISTRLDSLVEVAERRTLRKFLSIMDNLQHPLRRAITAQKSSFSHQFLTIHSTTEESLIYTFICWKQGHPLHKTSLLLLFSLLFLVFWVLLSCECFLLLLLLLVNFLILCPYCELLSKFIYVQKNKKNMFLYLQPEVAFFS